MPHFDTVSTSFLTRPPFHLKISKLFRIKGHKEYSFNGKHQTVKVPFCARFYVDTQHNDFIVYYKQNKRMKKR